MLTPILVTRAQSSNWTKLWKKLLQVCPKALTSRRKTTKKKKERKKEKEKKAIAKSYALHANAITILKSLYKNVNVKFTVGKVTHIVSSIISIKQGDILDPKLFTIFIAAIMITWRKMYDRPLCICRTKKYFILTGRRSLTKGTDFSLSDSEYADDTTVLFDSRETLETFSPVLFNCFEKFGMEVHVDHCDQPNKPTKTEVLFGSTPPSSYAESTTFDDRNLQPINLGNNRFQPVLRKFSYLGTTLNIDCRDNEDFVFIN